MAMRYGQSVKLADEIVYYLEHQPPEAPVSRWLIRDYLDGARGITFSKEEFSDAIRVVEKEHGVSFPDGSLAASIQFAAPGELIDRIMVERKVFPNARLNWFNARKKPAN